MSTKASAAATVGQLRAAVPAHCWKPLWRWTVWYTTRNIGQVVIAAALAHWLIPQIQSLAGRIVCWVGYGYLQGLSMAGLWVLGHECGHRAFAPSKAACTILGFFFHSALLTPYFSWASTHHRHHMHANNLDKDHAWVPVPRTNQEKLSASDHGGDRLTDTLEDVPLVVLMRLICQQILGFQTYMLTNLTSPPGTLHSRKSTRGPLRCSHYHPYGLLFRDSEAGLVLLSDLGILLALACLVAAAQAIGYRAVLLLYIQPYLWLNHWLVTITFLQHTDSRVPKYRDSAWTFLRGATGTVDRSFGWVGRFFFHDTVDYHTVHHIFPRIPFYYGKEATEAIRSLLGDLYLEDRETPYILSLWRVFNSCRWVEPDDSSVAPERQTFWYRSVQSRSRI